MLELFSLVFPQIFIQLLTNITQKRVFTRLIRKTQFLSSVEPDALVKSCSNNEIWLWPNAEKSCRMHFFVKIGWCWSRGIQKTVKMAPSVRYFWQWFHIEKNKLKLKYKREKKISEPFWKLSHLSTWISTWTEP